MTQLEDEQSENDKSTTISEKSVRLIDNEKDITPENEIPLDEDR